MKAARYPTVQAPTLLDRVNEAISEVTFKRDRLSDEIERLKAAQHLMEKFGIFNMTMEEAEMLEVLAKLAQGRRR